MLIISPITFSAVVPYSWELSVKYNVTSYIDPSHLLIKLKGENHNELVVLGFANRFLKAHFKMQFTKNKH